MTTADAIELRWHDARELTIEGKGWRDTDRFFERIPLKMREIVTHKHWVHSQCPAGMVVRFITDAPSIALRWDGYQDQPGYTGLDLYVRHEGTWRWLSVAQASDTITEKVVVNGLPVTEREYLLYLPLFHQLQQLEVGIPASYELRAAEPRPQKPIVFYGTSITQGSRASRAGMPYSCILGRRLDWPVINLGFSGHGNLDPRFIDLLCELDPAIYVVDCLPNLTAPQVEERLAPAICKLRAARPDTPIVLVEMAYGDAFLKPDRQARCAGSNQAQHTIYQQLVRDGVGNLHYVTGDDLIGTDGDATIDGTHYTDLGYMRYADKVYPILHRILNQMDVS